MYNSKEIPMKSFSIAYPFSIEEFEKEYHKNEGNDYINLGVCYLKRREKGDVDLARECYQNALSDFMASNDKDGITLATCSLSELDFNQTNSNIFHNSEEEYNRHVNEFFDVIALAQKNGDYETFVTASCLLSKLFMEYGEYGTAEREISSLGDYMEINLSVSSKVRYHEIMAEWYIRHNMVDECLKEIEEAFQLIEKSGDDIYLKRNLCICEVRLLGHSSECLDYTKKCLAYLRDSNDIQTIDRYRDEIQIDTAISIINENRPIFHIPLFCEMGQDYLKEKSKVIRAAIIRATFYNNKEILVLLFEKLISECIDKLNLDDLCRICFAYVEASKRLTEGIYKYEATYTLITFLQASGLDENGITCITYIDDVLNSDNSNAPEYNDIIGKLYASKANILLLRGDTSESENCFIFAREKLCNNDSIWQTQVRDRLCLLVEIERADMIMNTLQLSYPHRSKDELESMYKTICSRFLNET